MSIVHSAIASFACVLALGLAVSPAQAEEVSEDRKESRIIQNGTAWMPKAGEVNLELGIDQERRPTGSASIGLGDVAELGLVLQHERSVCDSCEDPNSDSSLLNISSAFFKMGTPEGMGHKHVPAFALVFRKSVLKKAQILSDAERVISKPKFETRGATLTAMASKSLGPAAVHLGAEMLVADGGDAQGDYGVDEYVIRPALAAQWTPPAYPLSTFLIDLRWVNAVSGQDESFEWDSRMTGAWGVRYQALDWAAVDLNVRVQEGQGLGDALVTLGLRGHFALVSGPPTSKWQRR